MGARVEGRAGDPASLLLLNGRRFAGHHRLVHQTSPFDNDPVHGHTFARAYAEQVADDDGAEGYVLLPFVTNNPCGIRGHSEELTDGGTRPPPGAELEDLPKQHDRGDHDSRVEIRFHDSVNPEPRWK
jgi:hypothetical protein